MAEELLTTRDAARRLGIAPATLYGWLAQSNAGAFRIRGQLITIQYLQGGADGKGRIRIEAHELERLIDLMRVRPQRSLPRRRPTREEQFPGICVKLGLPT